MVRTDPWCSNVVGVRHLGCTCLIDHMMFKTTTTHGIRWFVAHDIRYTAVARWLGPQLLTFNNILMLLSRFAVRFLEYYGWLHEAGLTESCSHSRGCFAESWLSQQTIVSLGLDSSQLYDIISLLMAWPCNPCRRFRRADYLSRNSQLCWHKASATVLSR